MKKWMWILVLILLIIIFSCQKKNEEEQTSLEKAQEKEKVFPVAQEVENKIVSAINSLKEGKASEGANLILEAVLLTRPSEYMPENFENKILKARQQFKDGNIHKGVESVSEALLLAKSSTDIAEERDKEKPKDVKQTQREGETAPIAELVRDKILAALEEFKKGNADKGVILLLESLQYLAPHSD